MASSGARRVVLVERWGSPDVLSYQLAPLAAPTPDEVQIRVAAIGVNFADVQRRRAPYPGAPEPPFLPGLEVAGTVSALGTAVRGLRVGDRVAAFPTAGAYADVVTAPARMTLRLPDALDFETGASALTVGITAYNLLGPLGRLTRSERVLVLSAAGGVGGVAVQLAKAYGAGLVIGAVGSQAKVATALEAGADAVIDYQREPLAERVRALSGGAGMDLVLDSVGAGTLEESIASLAPFGRVVVFGQSSGPLPPIAFGPLFARGQSVLGYSGGLYRRLRPTAARATGRRVLDMLVDGRLRIRLGARFPLSQAAEAHHLLESRANVGKIVLIP
jgi:NADPH2:quinone reductase